ncbi:type IX secretion system protein PorQ [Porphyromonadaceae bacterium]
MVVRRLLLFLCVIVGLTLRGQTTHSVFGFLELPSSSHINALGGSNVSTPEADISILFHNPAFLGAEMDKQGAMSYMNYMGGINVGSAIYGQTIGPRGAWAAAARYVDYGNFKMINPDGTPTGTFTAKDIVVQGTYSYDLTDRLRGGVTIKFISSAYEQYTSLALGADAGLSYYDSEKGFGAGVVFKNWGSQIKAYNDSFERMPWDIQIGVTKKIPHTPFYLSLTWLNSLEWDLTAASSSGGKDSFSKTLFKHFVFAVDIVPSQLFYVSVGYNPKRADDFSLTESKGFAGFSLGAGLNIGRLQAHASWAQHHAAGSSLMLGVNYHFGSKNL